VSEDQAHFVAPNIYSIAEIFRAEERVKVAGISYEPENDAARKLYAKYGKAKRWRS
jgi:cytochrome oxidase Cu insertion factor (SCO1/SenC/PrrC family)